jgi:hypothetical protein
MATRLTKNTVAEEPAAQTSLRSLRKLDCVAGVWKDGRKRRRASLHASRRRYAPPQHEGRGDISLISFMELVA